MPKRILIISLGVFAVLAAYSLIVPSHRSAGQSPTETTEAPSAETPTPAVTPVVPGLPGGLSGQLTYRTDRELVTVTLPSGAAIDHRPMPEMDSAVISADGLWSVTQDCEDVCQLRLDGRGGESRTIDASYIAAFRWSPDGHQFAYTISENGDRPTTFRLMLLDDPAAGQPELMYQTRSGLDHPFEWLSSGDLLVADNSGADSRLVRVSSDGTAGTIATVPTVVWYLYASPDRNTIAFTQDSPDGWQLWTVNAANGEIHNAGNMGSDPAGVAPPIENPPVPAKGPMYIAWSPDGQRIAFGGGYEPPYLMTIADLRTGVTHRTEFPDGYPGEIKWSPDGTKLAVSSYNLPRTHHESYVVDPDTGIARDVLSGCVIVWSPDSRFLAIHGEREPGVAIADVVTLEHAQLTNTAGDTPLSWKP